MLADGNVYADAADVLEALAGALGAASVLVEMLAVKARGDGAESDLERANSVS